MVKACVDDDGGGCRIRYALAERRHGADAFVEF